MCEYSSQFAKASGAMGEARRDVTLGWGCAPKARSPVRGLQIEIRSSQFAKASGAMGEAQRDVALGWGGAPKARSPVRELQIKIRS